jgi:hypothetical protein
MSLAFAEVSRMVAPSTSKVEPTALKYSKLCPILGDSIFDGDGVADVLGMAVAALGGCPGGRPLASGPACARAFVSITLSPWHVDDLGDSADLVISELVTNAVLWDELPNDLNAGGPVRGRAGKHPHRSNMIGFAGLRKCGLTARRRR